MLLFVDDDVVLPDAFVAARRASATPIPPLAITVSGPILNVPSSGVLRPAAPDDRERIGRVLLHVQRVGAAVADF